jgi:hypothetical protein
LYVGASYAEALGVLSKVQAAAPESASLREVLSFRALCLLALSRAPEAEQAVEQLVSRDPLYIPDPVETPPQLREMVKSVRSRNLPRIVRERYAVAKQLYQDHGSLDAIAAFDQVLLLLDAPEAVAGLGPDATADLRTLATSFRDLARTRSASFAPPPDAVATTGTTRLASAPVASPPAVPSRDTIFGPEHAGVIAPGVIRQELPVARLEWTRASAKGLLEIVIGADGSVESAVLRRGTHFAYDVLLLSHARQWRYTPALRNGSPVRYRKLIEFVMPAR